MIGADLQRALVAEAALAPSVHNVQPARWRFDGADGLILFEDRARRLPAGDPQGRDTAISLGAATEGMAIALSRHARTLADDPAPLPAAMGHVQPVRRFRIGTGATVDPLADAVDRRWSFRGTFDAPDAQDRRRAAELAGSDCTIVTEPARLAAIARDCDEAGLFFFRDPAFRAELVSWMRFSPRHPHWHRDGLNAAAMAMARVEAVGARVLLGRRLFPLIDRLDLSAPLTSEAAKIRSSAALLLFHRAADEDPFDTGRGFYRLWLRVAQAGLQGAVMAAPADHPRVSARLAQQLGLPAGRRIVNTLRVGRPPPQSDYPRARLPVDEILV